MANVDITINDSQGRVAAAMPLLGATIRAALDELDRCVAFAGTIDVVVNADSLGRFAASGDTVVTAPVAGRTTYEAALAAEARNGTDPNPQAADVLFTIDPSTTFAAGLWWDPNIGSTLAARVPADRVDAYSVVMHELLHALGVAGFRNLRSAGSSSRSCRTSAGRSSRARSWMSSIVGTRAMAAYLVGHDGDEQPSGTALSDVDGIGPLGYRWESSPDGATWTTIAGAATNAYTPSAAQVGLRLRAVVEYTDARGKLESVASAPTASVLLWRQGSDGADTIAGGALGDAIDGLGGNDTISGGGAADLISTPARARRRWRSSRSTCASAARSRTTSLCERCTQT